MGIERVPPARGVAQWWIRKRRVRERTYGTPRTKSNFGATAKLSYFAPQYARARDVRSLFRSGKFPLASPSGGNPLMSSAAERACARNG